MIGLCRENPFTIGDPHLYCPQAHVKGGFLGCALRGGNGGRDPVVNGGIGIT